MNAITLFDTSIRQDANGLFSLNDLHKAAGGRRKHEPNRFMRLDSTQELIAEISSSPDLGITPVNTVKGNFSTGATQGTYVCRELVIAYAAWISAAFHIKVIRVFLAAATSTPQRSLLPRPQPAYMREAWFAVLSHMAQQMVHRALARALQIHESTLSQVLNGTGKYGAGTASMAGMEARVLHTFCHARSRLRRAAQTRQLTLI